MEPIERDENGRERFTIEEVFEAFADEIFRAWTSSDEHARMTGSPATVEASQGGEFEAWDRYIRGRFVSIDPRARRLVMAWRTTDFGEGAEDSLVELELTPVGEAQTKLVLRHRGVPAGTAEDFRAGWRDYYFRPMQAYFKTKVTPAMPGEQADDLEPPAVEPKPKANTKTKAKTKTKTKPKAKAKRKAPTKPQAKPKPKKRRAKR